MLNRAAWQTGIQMDFDTFYGNADADVVIVGGGLTGVTAALMLTSLGLRVVLLEKDTLGCGATQGCTGKATAHQPEVYAAIYRSAGRRAAQTYAQLMQESMQDIRALLERMGQPLGVQATTMAVYAATVRELPTLRRYAALEDALGLPVAAVSNRLPHQPTQQAVAMPDQLLLEPMGYLAAMSQLAYTMGCRIYEHSAVTHYSEHRVQTAHGIVRAAWVVICTGYPLDLHRASVICLMQQHVLEARVLRTSLPLTESSLSITESGVNLRPIRQGVLLSGDLGPSGRQHRPREGAITRQQELLMPDARELQRLHRQDTWTMDGLPLIGPIHPAQPYLLMAAGYNGWGLTGAMLAARVISGCIVSKPLRQAPLFLPRRFYPGHTLQQLRGGMRLTSGMLSGWLHPSAPVCPHMGCKLTYHAETGCWECPCHGSSFRTQGECCCTPAKQSAKVPAPPKDQR